MNKQKTALVLGCFGQDGSFCVDLLLEKGYKVIGTNRSFNVENINIISRFSDSNFRFHKFDLLNFNISTREYFLNPLIREYKPDEIYNFTGFTNVFKQEESNYNEIYENNTLVVYNILEAIRKYSPNTKFFQSSSSLIFGRSPDLKICEETPFAPIYHYGITKLHAHNLVNEYREQFGIFACNGIFFNHESERRGEKFFTRKVTKYCADLLLGSKGEEKLKLGNLTELRDIGYAKDYVEAAILILQNEKPTDYIIGSGKTIYLLEFVEKCFNYIGLNWEDYIDFDPELSRNEKLILESDISKIQKELGWKPKTNIDQLVEKMINYDSKLCQKI